MASYYCYRYGCPRGAQNTRLLQRKKQCQLRTEARDGHRTACASQNASYDAIVVGGGPAGLATALALQKTGWERVKVLERQEVGAGGGTALGLWTNAWKALDALGVGDDVRRNVPRVGKVQVCREDSDRVLTSFDLSRCDGGPHEFRGVLRDHLVSCLTSHLLPNTIQYDTRVTSCNVTSHQGSTVTVETDDASTLTADLVIGADGIKSAIASSYGRMTGRDVSINYVGQTAIRGVATYDTLPCDCIRQVLGSGVRAGVYPVSEKELYWYVCFDDNENKSSSMQGEEILQEARMVLETSSQTWMSSVVWNAISRTPTDRVSRSRLGDRWDIFDAFSSNAARVPIALAGDALHPMTPNLGQGGCTALEDAVILASCLCAAGAHQKPSGRDRSRCISESIGEYTRQRATRVTPLVIRSNLMGRALQTGFPPIVFARDTFISNAFNPSHFLDHATFDCGELGR
mmetsp:Transcript_8187/g.16416  ORF Transcript_8187/g.16416 Transcript_8187/m.16416 type:complete len:460 (+) Transcript_8187:21-1400(+)